MDSLFLGPAGIVPNIGIAILHHLVQGGYYIVFNDTLTLGITRNDGGNRLECFRNVESNVGNVIVCQAQRCAENITLAKDGCIERRRDGLGRTVSGG